MDGENVWRVGQTAEHRLMYGRSIKAATSRNEEVKVREKEVSQNYLK